MKKLIISTLAALTLTATAVYADMPSGMKDISYKAGEGDVVYTLPETTVSHGAQSIYRGEEFPFKVSVSSGSEKTEYYTINFLINNEIYDSAELVISPGKTATYEKNVPDVPRGNNKVVIQIVAGNGKIISSYSDQYNMLPGLVDAYFEDYTRHVGVSGAFSVDMIKEVAQFNTCRFDVEWPNTEQGKGSYTFNKNYLKDAEKYGVDAVVLLTYNNTFYADSTKQGINSKENLEAFVNYSKAIQDAYKGSPRLKYYEFWNEPNGTWRPRNMTDYAYSVEVVNRSLKQEEPEAKLTISSCADGDYSYVDEAMENGAWPNIEAVIDHPYIRPTKVDIGYRNILGGYAKAITKHGGWKPYNITEVGWPTHTSGITPEQQRIELVKQVIVADWYGCDINQMYMLGDGSYWAWYSPDASEANFGIFYTGDGAGGWKLKPSAFSLSNLTYETIGSFFVGKIIYDDKDIEGYLYLRDGELTCVMWSKNGEKTVTFEGESLRATDIIGNYVGTGSTFTLGESPIYLHGLSKKHIKNELSENIDYYLETFLADSFAESEGKKGFDKAKALIKNTSAMAKEFSDNNANPTTEQILEGLKAHMNVSNQIIDMYAAGELEITLPQLNGLLYANHWGAELWTNLYMVNVDPDALKNYTPTALAEREKALEIRKQKSGENTLSYSEAILEYAQDFGQKAKSIYEKAGTNPLKAGVVVSYDELAKELVKTAQKLSDVEPVGYDNVFAQLPSSQTTIEIGVDQAPLLSIWNFRDKKELSGYAELVAPDGTVVSRTQDFTVAAGGSAQYPLNMLITAVSENPYTIRLYEGGQLIKEGKVTLKGLQIFKAELQNAKSGFEGVDSISVAFSDIVGRNFEGTITIEPLCDWKLENAVDIPVSVKANSSETLKFNVVDKKSVTFHEYPFRIIVKNTKGEIVVNNVQFLNFQVFNKSEEEYDITEFTGDISFFKDAYPVYKSTPDEPMDVDNWFDNGNYTRTYMKWTDENLYFLFDVTDWYHENSQAGYSIYNGDSIQFFFDPLNTNGEEYDADDYQFGLALSEINPGKQVYAWHDPVVGKSGDKPSEWTTIIRNHDIGITRYIAKLPRTAMPEMNLTEGHVFGFTVAYNTSDLGTRSGYIEFTPGICDSHYVEGIWDFTLIDDDFEFDIEKDTILPVNIEGVSELEYDNSTTFSDIEGHWAKDDIIYGVKRGYLDGISELEFRPNNPLMRLVGCSSIAKIDDVSIWPTEAVYDDVTPDLYHAGVINSAKTMGVIPDEMIVNGRFQPGDNLSREEFFAMLAMYYSQKRGEVITDDISAIDTYVDSAEITEGYKAEIAYLLRTGILAGNGNGELRPKDDITRAEMISLIVRVVKAIEGGSN